MTSFFGTFGMLNPNNSIGKLENVVFKIYTQRMSPYNIIVSSVSSASLYHLEQLYQEIYHDVQGLH